MIIMSVRWFPIAQDDDEVETARQIRVGGGKKKSYLVPERYLISARKDSSTFKSLTDSPVISTVSRNAALHGAKS